MGSIVHSDPHQYKQGESLKNARPLSELICVRDMVTTVLFKFSGLVPWPYPMRGHRTTALGHFTFHSWALDRQALNITGASQVLGLNNAK